MRTTSSKHKIRKTTQPCPSCGSRLHETNISKRLFCKECWQYVR